MTADLPQNVAEYSGRRRGARERGREDGTVRPVGKRVKKWEGTYHVYVPVPGARDKRIKRKRIVGECSKMTKAQAQDEHREWIRRLYQLPVADTSKATVGQLADDYYSLCSGDWGEEHAGGKRSMIERIIKPGLGRMAVEDVTAEHLKRFVNELPRRRWRPTTTYTRNGRTRTVEVGETKTGISVSYVKKIITTLRKMFDLASERDLIRKNPARGVTIRMTVPKAAAAPDKSVFPPGDLPALLSALDRRDSLIFWISVLGATRPNELFAVRGASVGPGWIRIQRALDRKRREKSTKTSKTRFIFLPAELDAELHAWIAENGIGPQDLVFQNRDGREISRQNFLGRRLRGAAKRAGIATQDVDFQMLRRSFATLAGALGTDIKSIQAQLGHARPDITITEYMQPVDDARRQALGRLESILRGRAPMPVDAAAKLGTAMIQ